MDVRRIGGFDVGAWIARPSRLNPRVPVPWRLPRLPAAVPVVAGAAFLSIAALKLAGPTTLCAGPRPFGPVNAVMFTLELGCGTMLLRRRWGRRLAAAIGGAMMLGATAFLARAELKGVDTRGCDCFGPIRLPFAGHLAVIAVLLALCTLVFLHEETRTAAR